MSTSALTSFPRKTIASPDRRLQALRPRWPCGCARSYEGYGRFSTPYGVGNEVRYIFELPPDKGRRHIRLITDRRIAFGEAYASTRSKEYSVGAVDLFLTPDRKGSEGTAFPACKLKISKKTQQIEVETYQNPWKLTKLTISKK